MHKSATKCNETLGKWCKNKHGASKIIDTLETYQPPGASVLRRPSSGCGVARPTSTECAAVPVSRISPYRSQGRRARLWLTLPDVVHEPPAYLYVEVLLDLHPGDHPASVTTRELAYRHFPLPPRPHASSPRPARKGAVTRPARKGAVARPLAVPFLSVLAGGASPLFCSRAETMTPGRGGWRRWWTAAARTALLPKMERVSRGPELLQFLWYMAMLPWCSW
jgi:hypothetical protein